MMLKLRIFINILGCETPEIVDDNDCNDISNIPLCNYDGGDCCGVNLQNCDDCICYPHLTCDAPLELISNGFCNDETNNEDCNYDGNDCCGACANKESCTECACHNQDELSLDLSCKYIFR